MDLEQQGFLGKLYRQKKISIEGIKDFFYFQVFWITLINIIDNKLVKIGLY